MKILLIENDVAFAQELAQAIEARGVEARVTGDGKEGVDLAKVDRPDLIVLCVELPRMSGYSVCNKLKKDEQLKSIPLVIISAEATPETFEQHRKLKTRAEGYLIKPFEPAALLATIEGLVDLPPEPPVVSSDDLVSLDEVELDTAEADPAQPSALTIAPQAAAEDDDLKLLDEAFESLASEDVQPEEGPAPEIAPAAAEASAEGEVIGYPEPIIGHPEVGKLGDEADVSLMALDAEEITDVDLGRAAALFDATPVDGSAAARLAAMAAADPDAGKDAEIGQLQGRIAELLAEVACGSEMLERRNGELSKVSARLRALEADLQERQAGATRDERLRRPSEEQTRGAETAVERPEAALRTAAEETRRAEERARALEADVKRETQRAEREEQARKAADTAAAAAAERARAAEERTRAAEARARAAEEHLHAAEERVHAAEQLTHAAEARAVTADARTSAAEARADTAEQESASLRLRLDEVEQGASFKAAEADQVRQRAEGLARELDTALAQVAAQESDLATLRPELEGVRTELASTRAAADGAHAEAERKLAEARKRISDLEAQNAKHEERIVKAYQKIKADEKVREKTKKALAVAVQLLDDRVVGASPAEVPSRRE